MFILASSDVDWAVIGGAVGTLILAAVAVYQSRHSRRQTRALEDQVVVVRDGAAAEQAAMREELRASVEQGDAVREAARAQVQPIVFAQAISGVIRNREEGDDLAEGHLGFPYQLSNEGTGVALNVTHGVEIAGMERAFGDGREIRSIRPGETVPRHEGMDGIRVRRLVAAFPKDELSENWESLLPTYWVRFENVFGDKFETRNPLDTLQSASFTRTMEKRMPEQAPTVHQASSPSMAAPSEPPADRRRWNSHTSVAAITAAAAVLGALVGGLASYVGNNRLQNSQDWTAARGAGRVLQADFARAATRIEVELTKHLYIAPDQQPPITISAEDEKEIASNVSARTWDHIAAAKLVLQDEQESATNTGSVEVLVARAHQPVALKGARLRFETSTLRALDGAVIALKELTGTESAE